MIKMEQQLWSDFLLKQLPVIVVLSIFCYFMYKYFTGVIKDNEKYFRESIEAKDKIIMNKDTEIKELNAKILDTFNKNTEVINGLRDLIAKLLAK